MVSPEFLAELDAQSAAIDTHADLGYGVESRHRVLRRLLARVLWPWLRRQIVVNRALARKVQLLEGELVRARGDIEHHTSVLLRHERPLQDQERTFRRVEQIDDKLDLAQRQMFAVHEDDVGELRSSLSGVMARLRESDMAEDRAAAEIDRLRTELRRLAQRIEQEQTWHDQLGDVAMRLTQLDLYLGEARRQYPRPIDPSQVAHLASGLDALYPAFDELVRGPSQLVRERAHGYVEDLRRLGIAGPVLDLGCGRGDLLELLGRAGYVASGVDTSALYVQHCLGRGLDVRKDDARTHLSTVEPGSLGAVTAIQFLEHLTPDEVVAVIGLVAVALRPGGVLLIETPNPENLLVATSDFYADPTRSRPLPAKLLRFVLEARGFTNVEFRATGPGASAPSTDLRPVSETEPCSKLKEILLERALASAEYAVIARRA